MELRREDGGEGGRVYKVNATTIEGNTTQRNNGERKRPRPGEWGPGPPATILVFSRGWMGSSLASGGNYESAGNVTLLDSRLQLLPNDWASEISPHRVEDRIP